MVIEQLYLWFFLLLWLREVNTTSAKKRKRSEITIVYSFPWRHDIPYFITYLSFTNDISLRIPSNDLMFQFMICHVLFPWSIESSFKVKIRIPVLPFWKNLLKGLMHRKYIIDFCFLCFIDGFWIHHHNIMSLFN